MNIHAVILLAIEIVSVAAFTYLFTLFVQLYRRVRAESLLLYTAFLLLLLIGQLCGALSIIAPDPRIAATLFVASSSFAVAGFLILLYSSLSRGELFMLIPLLVAFPDMLAGALSTAIVAFSARGLTRIFLAILSLSYYIRGFGVLLTALQGFFPILLVSETVRAVAAVLLAIHHTLQVSSHG